MSSNIDIENQVVEMKHGGGGRAMAQLIEEIFVSSFDNDMLNAGNDMAEFSLEGKRFAMSTDGYVISPLFFPGGDIGSMAVHGTVNDISMSGAKPKYLTASFIIEEGFPLKDLKKIADNMAKAAKEAGVSIVTGDTKIVEKGKGDGVFISTSGIGVITKNVNTSGSNAKIGDKIILSGTLGDHGIAIMSKREDLSFDVPIISDSSSLNHMVENLVNANAEAIHVMRDATRGGLSATLNEIAKQSNIGMLLNEKDIPIKEEVLGACEILGLDPLNIANEGKMICICDPKYANDLLNAMKQDKNGKNASIIGEVIEDKDNFIEIETIYGTRRIVDWLNGEQLPRIC